MWKMTLTDIIGSWSMCRTLWGTSAQSHNRTRTAPVSIHSI